MGSPKQEERAGSESEREREGEKRARNRERTWIPGEAAVTLVLCRVAVQLLCAQRERKAPVRRRERFPRFLLFTPPLSSHYELGTLFLTNSMRRWACGVLGVDGEN